MSTKWHFFMDVGGTFTDVVARNPSGKLLTHKLLSSGVLRGVIGPGSGGRVVFDPALAGQVPDLYCGYKLRLAGVGTEETAGVESFESSRGALRLDHDLGSFESRLSYEIISPEPAPILAIRQLMGLRLDQPIGPVEVRLGTTRATNALLERKGGRLAFVTTKGFGDILRIGYQDRPRLFELNIRKRDELPVMVVEIEERLDARGEVLFAPNRDQVRAVLERVFAAGVNSLAVCLLHAHINPDHEQMIGEIADSIGFEQVSLSSSVARMQGLVSRGDTTVVDAYLSPVIRGYVAELRQCLPEAKLTLMTSFGGLIDAESVTGKDTLLSGPAGGVIGCRLVARSAGFAKAIGFDMGGTSTDVSRIDESPDGVEYTYDTVKAGVRVVAPMLAVETVAAGGGSICNFDGQKLTVGPKSAGADPGPACYGRGGPLTITDMNVALGRIPARHFPFPLDRVAVTKLLDVLAGRIRSATDRRLSQIELADGFLRIANAHMGSAIKRVSIAKGYDVREYGLVAFGGAGGQHACAVAEILGMSRVLLNPYAGVLSALGIGAADIKRIGQRSVEVTLISNSQETIESLFSVLAAEQAEALRRQGISLAQVDAPRYRADLSYAGQSGTIDVCWGTIQQVRTAFENAHQRLYGYIHTGRDILVRTIRVEIIAKSQPLELGRSKENVTFELQTEKTPLVVEGEFREAPLLHRSDLRAGQCIVGPAVIVEDTSTIVIDPGWEGEVSRDGNVILAGRVTGSGTTTISEVLDPIYLELFSHQFQAIAEQMGTTLRRTALSTNVKERLDFSCAIFSPNGDLVVNAPHIPVHLGGMSDCVKALIEDIGTFEVGDVYLTNDPFRGGSHLNDVTVITPVHDDASRKVILYVANRAHHAEIGGKRPGSMPPDSTCLAEEGVLIRAFPFVRNGRSQEHELRQLLSKLPFPSRTPEENLADVAAQAAANQTGVRELKSMATHYGLNVMHAYMRHIQESAGRKIREMLRRLPNGNRAFEDGLDDGAAIRLCVRKHGDEISFDFTGTDAVLAGNLNANASIVCSAVLYSLRCLLNEDIPLNAGVLDPVKITLPECFLNSRGHADPRQSPAVAGGNVETSQRIVDCIFGAMETVAASQGTMNNLLMGNDRFGYYETICGGAGAGPRFHGADAVHTHMTNTRATDPEVLESRYPVRLHRFAIRRGSGGRGQYHGGCGIVRELEFLEPLEVSMISQRRTRRPYGLQGGEPGMSGRNLLQRNGEAEFIELPPIVQLSVQTGDRLIIETPGGGGYGTPE